MTRGTRPSARSSATRSRNTVMPLVQPMRSATTVAGMSGVSANNRRMAGSNASTAEPRSSRTYFGASSERNAVRTVLRATPSRRAMAFAPIASALCNLLISAHSSTLIKFPLPVGRCRPGQARAQTTESGGPSGEGVSFRPLIGGHYWAGVDSETHRDSTQDRESTHDRCRGAKAEQAHSPNPQNKFQRGDAQPKRDVSQAARELAHKVLWRPKRPGERYLVTALPYPTACRVPVAMRAPRAGAVPARRGTSPSWSVHNRLVSHKAPSGVELVVAQTF